MFVGDRRMPLIAGVELGGTKCVCTLASGPDDVREQVRLPTTTPEETLARIGKVLRRWKADFGFESLGIGSFGPLDLDEHSESFGSIVSTPKPRWTNTDLLALGCDLDVPIAIDTDVNGAALAEGRWGAARGLRSFAYITVGTGIGVGTIISGQPVRGLGHSEAGHMRVARLPSDDWPGVCPYHGDCVEGLAAGPALLARTGQIGETLAPEHPVWRPVIHALGGLLHNLVLTAAPERILIGGGVFSSNSHLFQRLRPVLLRSLASYGPVGQLEIEIDDFVTSPDLGPMAGPFGSVALGLLRV